MAREEESGRMDLRDLNTGNQNNMILIEDSCHVLKVTLKMGVGSQ